MYLYVCMKEYWSFIVKALTMSDCDCVSNKLTCVLGRLASLADIILTIDLFRGYQSRNTSILGSLVPYLQERV